MNFTFVNSVLATLASGINSSATTATLSDNSGAFDDASASAPVRARIYNSTDYKHPSLDPNSELVDITAANGLNITAMTRGAESTTPADHNTPNKTYKITPVATAAMMNEIQHTLGRVGTGDPNGSEDGYPGTMYKDTDSGTLYVKTSAKGTLTGWE